MRMNKATIFIVMTTCVTFSVFCDEQGERSESKMVRKPVVAGLFYPGDKKNLESKVRQYLNETEKVSLPGRPIAIVVPHAGYEYSGRVAAHAFKQLENMDIKKVILIGPSHHYPFSGASVYEAGSYETPLGLVKIDQDLAAKFTSASKNIRFQPPAHASEHALEVELPFLQVLLSDFQIVPIIIGDQQKDTAEILSKIFISVLEDKQSIIVVSCDLSHFHTYDDAVRLDHYFLDLVEKLDIAGFEDAVNRGKVEIDAPAAILATLLTAKQMGPAQATVLKYANSGDVTGDKSRVVGYSAIAITIPETARGKEEYLNTKDKEELLQLARRTVETHVRKGETLREETTNPKLQEKRGVFVTLKKDNQLRGCIGYVEPIYPLQKAIIKAAISAASKDPRFPPVRPAEIDKLHIEVSVLTVPRKITDVNEITVGKHGLIIKKGVYQGLLLPQVATEYGWDRNTFLEQTCHKAGLPADAWQKGAEIYTFSAEVFGEQD